MQIGDEINETDRTLVEAIRRERGRLSRAELCKKFQISTYKLDWLIKRYELITAKCDEGGKIPEWYNLDLAKRTLAAEIAKAKATAHLVPPYKHGNLEWK